MVMVEMWRLRSRVQAGVQEVEENDPEGNYKLFASSLAR